MQQGVEVPQSTELSSAAGNHQGGTTFLKASETEPHQLECAVMESDCADSDAWAAVFSIAGGSGDPFVSFSRTQHVSAESVPSRHHKKRRRASNRRERGRAATSSEAPLVAGDGQYTSKFQQYLSERSSSEVAWPTWMHLQEGLDPRICDGWVGDDASSAPMVVAFVGQQCKRCHRSPGFHLACAGQTGSAGSRHGTDARGSSLSKWLQLFLALRNLRCAAVQTVLCKGSEDSFDMPPSMADCLYEEWNQSVRIILMLQTSSVMDALQRACCDVDLRALQKLTTGKSSSSDTRWDLVESAVKLIVSLDGVYFQLYYAQITQQLPLPAPSWRDGFVPHPLSYFGLIAVDLASSEPALQELLDAMPLFSSSSEEAKQRRLSDQFGLACTDPSTISGATSKEPTLKLLHRFRLYETVALFRNWKTRASTRRQIFDSCRSITDPHETSAPALLMRWRDSCRDFLCHLYSYATLSRDTLHCLGDVLAERNVSRVLELGAGTGYLAHLMSEHLSRHGIAIEAVDLYPTTPLTSSVSSSKNEYHGQTPPFFSISSGSESVLETQGVDWSRTGLVLCYPPPQSPFPCRALKHFVERNGRVLVFIGEFKGLTGSSGFEKLLQRRFVCEKRLPTLCWGTDASSVTIWTSRTSSRGEVNDAPSESPLLPCTFCDEAESLRRCRLLRCLNYCSKRCFDSDKKNRQAALELVMIDLVAQNPLDFYSNQHFSNL